MKMNRLALRVLGHTVGMMLGVYLVMQVFTYLRDNLILGISGLSGLPGFVLSFMATTVLPPTLGLGAVIFLLALRIQRVGERLEAGETISPEEAERTRTRILRFSTVILVANLIGFAAGFVLMMVLRGKAAEMVRPDRLVVLVSNIAGAFVYASAQTSLNDVAFSSLRDMLGIREIGNRRRERSSTTRQVALSASLVVYVVTMVQFNVRDVVEFDAVADDVSARVLTGALSRESAGDEYRRLLGERLDDFVSRPGLELSRVPLPWERPDSAQARQQRVFFMYLAFTLAVALGIQTAVSASIREQLSAISRRVRDVLEGGGDLRLRLNVRAMDDLGELTDLLNRLLDRIHGLAKGIGAAAAQTRTGAEAIDRELGRSEELSRRTRDAVVALEAAMAEQSRSARGFVTSLRSFRDSMAAADAATADQKRFVAETSAAMEEMAASIRSISAMTERSGALSGELAERGEAGGSAVRDTRAAIAEIDTAAKQVLGVLAALNKISADINLLAMNAAIEAAHAGDAGRGFAVVAAEVRTLATTAAERTRAIKDLIADMGKRVGNGVQRAEASGVALNRLVEGVRESATISVEIASAAKEQAAGTDAVLEAVGQAVRSAESVEGLISRQTEKSEGIAQSLEDVLSRLEALATQAGQRSEEVKALEASFAAVRKEVDANLASVSALDQEMAAFTV